MIKKEENKDWTQSSPVTTMLLHFTFLSIIKVKPERLIRGLTLKDDAQILENAFFGLVHFPKRKKQQLLGKKTDLR